MDVEEDNQNSDHGMDMQESEMAIQDQSATPIVAIPSLRGKLLIEGSSHVCRGQWALSDYAHGIPGQSSDFEFRLIKANDGSNAYPISGRYQGFFYLKMAKGHVKVEDKEINIRFIAIVGDENCHRVEGEGSNKFGKFKVYGTLSGDGFLQMYREYFPKEFAGVKRKSISGGSVPKSNVVGDVNREGGPRIRKGSSLGSSFVSGKPGLAKASSVPAASEVPRTPRLSQHMVKCAEVLKELMKHAHAIWFTAPVDYMALKLPDYPTIIKEPMDFGTIQKNLDRHFYTSIDAFSEHMRLVFRNAITYNTLRDNPVHIAARELSNRFEDRYRNLISQLTAQGYGQVASDTAITKAIGGAGGKRGAKKATLKRSASYGPQKGIPLAVDGGYVELQRKMNEMQAEISCLRTQLKQNEVKTELELHVKDAKNPLTFDEKKNLVEQIKKLDMAKMDEVFDIIGSVTDVKDGGDDEVEISIDDLDTHTLRRLQSFVHDSTSKREYQDDADYNPVKKARKEPRPKAAASKKSDYVSGFGSAAQSGPQVSSGSANAGDFTLFGSERYDNVLDKDSDGEEAGDDFDFDLVPNDGNQ